MTLIINNKQIEQLAHKLAEQNGLAVEEAIRRALQDSLAQAHSVSEAEKAERLQRIGELLARIDALPVLDDRTPDEIIGYDEHGLPR